MRTLKQLVNRPEEFKTYLEQQPEGEIVGVASHTCECPFALYVKKVKPRSGHVEVNQTQTYQGGRNPTYQHNPQWLQTFINRVDVKTYLTPVTREEALEALNERVA